MSVKCVIPPRSRRNDTNPGLDAAWLKDVLEAMKKASDSQKPLDPNVREAWRVMPRAAALQQKASALYDLLVRIDSSVERWFVPFSGLVASEIEEQLRQAIETEKRGEIEDARRRLEDLADIAPSHGGAQQALGSLLVAHYPETRISQAQKALEKAVQLQPALAVAHQHLADVHFFRGDLPNAKRSYERAVELGRDALALSLFGLAQIAELEQDWQAAKGYYVRSARAENDAAARRVIDLCAVRIDRKAQVKK